MKLKQVKRNRILPVSILIVLIVTLTPGDGKIVGMYLDKIVHFLIFFFLSINILYKYNGTRVLSFYLFLAVLMGLGTEFFQQYIPGRNMDIIDAIADILGIVGAYLFYLLKPKKTTVFLLKLGA